MGDVYRYDGVACSVSLTAAGSQPVYRFYNVKKGVHFYTASPAERDSVDSPPEWHVPVRGRRLLLRTVAAGILAPRRRSETSAVIPGLHGFPCL